MPGPLSLRGSVRGAVGRALRLLPDPIRLLAVVVFTAAVALPGAGQAEAAGPGGGFTPRVIGGSVAPDGSWPSQAALLNASEPDAGAAQFCGGTLIDEGWVLTAAHCVTDDDGNVAPASAVEVAIGINDLRDITAPDRIGLTSIQVKPDYDPVTDEWDLALLELALASTQPTTDLISPGQEDLTDGGDPGAVAGWGCYGETACSFYPYPLIEAGVEFVSDALCGSESSYGSGFVAESMICAGNFATGLPDTCQGDSGGPLLAFAEGDVPVLAGVTSWGRGCAEPSYPGVYSRVLAGRDWILATMLDAYPLTASRTGTGQGTITSDPAGIDCGSVCEADFEDSTSVELTATPEPGSSFVGWSGDCSGTGTCEVTMDRARDVTATFAADPPPPQPVAPKVSITSRPSKRTGSRVASFRFRASETGSTFRCRLDGRPWRGCSSPKTYRGLERGRKHAFRVRATKDGLTGPIKLYRWYVKR